MLLLWAPGAKHPCDALGKQPHPSSVPIHCCVCASFKVLFGGKTWWMFLISAVINVLIGVLQTAWACLNLQMLLLVYKAGGSPGPEVCSGLLGWVGLRGRGRNGAFLCPVQMRNAVPSSLWWLCSQSPAKRPENAAAGVFTGQQCSG